MIFAQAAATRHDIAALIFALGNPQSQSRTMPKRKNTSGMVDNQFAGVIAEPPYL
jgi:hypothetical protein